MIREEQALMDRLEALEKAFKEFKEAETKGVNIFSAVGMARQEVKHSAFFAWLLTPYVGKQHDLGNAFLKAWLEKLFIHPNSDEVEPKLRTNHEILAKAGIHSMDDFAPLLNAKEKEVIVETERVVINPESRMDILITCESARMLIVIENKVGTSTHDAQLKRYEEKEIGEYQTWKDWKKVFVYLTPKGDHPYEDELEDGKVVRKYREHWCVYSYETILDILKKMIAKLSRSEKDRKLKFLMEDYVEMVNTQILKNNPVLLSKCKDIARKYKNELELLMAYAMDGLSDIIKCCKDKLKNYSEQLGQISVLNESDTRLEFVTEKIQTFFGENFPAGKDIYPVLIRLAARKGDVDITLFMENASGDPADWTEKQRQFAALFHQTVEGKNRYCSLVHVVLLSEEERYGELTEEQRAALDRKLYDFFNSQKMKALQELTV